jgi:hypothetical protein
VNVTAVWLVNAGGPLSITVSGAVESMEKVTLGPASTLPTWSVARACTV